jgi:hypothetical protein
VKLFRGHGTAVAIVLSAIAVVAAGTGTAVAVSSVVNIADPTTPANVAKVDASGRLSVGSPLATIDAAGYLYGYQNAQYTQITSATKATLAITRVQLSNPSVNAGATEEQLSLYQVPVDAGGSCVNTTSGLLLARYNLVPGDDVVDNLTAPITVRALNGAAYCLVFYNSYLNGAVTPGFYVAYGVSAYVTAGRYTGLGVTTAAANQPKSAKIGG